MKNDTRIIEESNVKYLYYAKESFKETDSKLVLLND